MGRHSVITIEPAPAPETPAERGEDRWRGYADQGTDLEGWLEAIRPDSPPMMEL